MTEGAVPVTCSEDISSQQEQLETLTGVASNSLGLGLQLRLKSEAQILIPHYQTLVGMGHCISATYRCLEAVLCFYLRMLLIPPQSLRHIEVNTWLVGRQGGSDEEGAGRRAQKL